MRASVDVADILHAAGTSFLNICTGYMSLAQLRKKRWVVYAKPLFAGAEAVLAYLSRYTRSGRDLQPSAHRLQRGGRHLPLQEDYRRDGPGTEQVMTLSAHEAIRSFLLHVLPLGFHRIHHYGLFVSATRKDAIARDVSFWPWRSRTSLRRRLRLSFPLSVLWWAHAHHRGVCPRAETPCAAICIRTNRGATVVTQHGRSAIKAEASRVHSLGCHASAVKSSIDQQHERQSWQGSLLQAAPQ